MARTRQQMFLYTSNMGRADYNTCELLSETGFKSEMSPFVLEIQEMKIFPLKKRTAAHDSFSAIVQWQ